METNNWLKCQKVSLKGRLYKGEIDQKITSENEGKIRNGISKTKKSYECGGGNHEYGYVSDD